jgi:hypothetical protein
MEVGALIILTVLLGGLAYILAEFSQYQEIRRNWPLYRCQPQITPFARYYGYDLQETINFCIKEQVKEHSGEVMVPLYKGMEKVMDTVDSVYERAEAIAGGVDGLLGEFKSFVVNFTNSFRLLGTRVRISLIRTKNIFDRVYGTFIAFVYASISAITFGYNMACNPLTVFIGAIAGVDVCCFAPETLVRMVDGSARPIRDVQIGDWLSGATGETNRVTSVMRFRGADVPMVRLRGVHVSGNHQVRSGGTWIPAGEHPEAISAECLPEIYCLNTTANTIPVTSPATAHDLVFTDYEESSDPTVVEQAQRMAEIELNADTDGSYGAPVADYSLGLDPTFTVLTGTGAWVPIESVKVGDVLAGGRRVSGVVREFCKSVVQTPGGHLMAAAQLVRFGGRWRRARWCFPLVGVRSRVLCHLFLEGGGAFAVGGDGEVFSVQGYGEVEEIQAVYDAALAGPKVDGAHRATPYPSDDEDDL